MGERTRGIATSVARLAVIGLGMIGQRLALGAEIAMPPQLAVQTGGNASNLDLPPVLMAQAQPISRGNAPDESGVSTTDAPTEPQSSTQEAISVPLMPGPSQKRRRPRMAGIPEGLRTPQQFPGGSAETQQAGTQENRTTGTETLLGAGPSAEAEAPGNMAETETENPEISGYESPGARAARKAEEQGAGRKYKLAPIHWRGTVFYGAAFRQNRVWGKKNYLLNQYPDRPVSAYKSTSISHTKGALMEASTFILHPWIAQVAGHLGIISDDSHPVPSINHSYDNRLLVGADLNLFSVTRFPFAMSYSQNDSRFNFQSSEVTNNTDVVTDTLLMSQRYQPLSGPDRYTAGLTYNKATYKYALDYGDFHVPWTGSSFSYSNLFGTYTTRFGRKLDQPFYLFGSHQTISSSMNPGNDTLTDNINAAHIYTPEEYLLTLKTNASFFQNRSSGLTSRNLMLATQGTWQPEDLDNPLIVSGKARYFDAENITHTKTTGRQILNASVFASYNKWKYLTLNAGGGLTETHSRGGGSSLTTTQFGRAVYMPPGNRLLNHTYRKSASTSFSNLTSSTGASNWTTSSTVSHSLVSGKGSNIKISDKRYRFSDRVAQSLSVHTNQHTGSSQTLTNSASLRLIPLGLRTKLPGTRFSEKGIRGFVRGSANLVSALGVAAFDSRTFGRNPSHRQSFKISLDAGAGSAYRAAASGYGANADLSIEYARTIRGGESGAVRGNAAWSHKFLYDYNYTRRKLFGVKKLIYRLRFTANIDPGLRASRYSDIRFTKAYATNSYWAPYGASLNQILSYRIGFNELVLAATIADDEGINSSSLFLRFRAWRNFGN